MTTCASVKESQEINVRVSCTLCVKVFLIFQPNVFYMVCSSAKMMNLSTEPMDISVMKKDEGWRLIVSAYCRSASKFVGVVGPDSTPVEANQTYEALMPYDKVGDPMARILKNPNGTIAIIHLETCGCSGKLQSYDPNANLWQNVSDVAPENALVQGGRNSFR